MLNLIDELKKILNLSYTAESATTKEEATTSHNKIREIVGDLIEEFGRKVSGRIRTEDDIKDIMNTCQVMNQRGDLLNPFDLKDKDFDAYVIIDSLSKTYRFWNQTRLTVAEHSLALAKVCGYSTSGSTEDNENAKWALIHELFEAYSTDLATPIKAMLPEYKKAEDKALEKFARLSGICPVMPEFVHLMDKRMMVDEAIAYMPNKEYWLKKNEPIGIEMPKDPMTPQVAKLQMAKAWMDLGLPDINGSLAHYLSEEGQQEEQNREKMFKESKALHQKISFVDQYGQVYEIIDDAWFCNQELIDSDDLKAHEYLKDLKNRYENQTNGRTNIIWTQDGSLYKEDDTLILELKNKNCNTEVRVASYHNQLVFLSKEKGTEDYYDWYSLDDLLKSLNTQLTEDSVYNLDEYEYFHIEENTTQQIQEFLVENDKTTDLKI